MAEHEPGQVSMVMVGWLVGWLLLLHNPPNHSTTTLYEVQYI
jgi:hypothetical protein